MLLHDCLDEYLLENPVCDQHAAQMRRSVVLYEGHLGRPATVDDLDDQPVNRWLVAMQSAGRKAWTLRGHRSRLLAVWRASVAAGHLDRGPRRVRLVRPPVPNPVALDRKAMRRLLAACEGVSGRFRGTDVRRSDWLRAWVLAGWDTGLRMGDMLALRRDHIRPDGVLAVVQHKTGRLIVHRIRPETIASLAKLPPKLFAVIGRRKACDWLRVLFARAGMIGTSKRIRQSSGTAVEVLNPGLGHLHLGNGRDVFVRHYLDQAAVQKRRPRPPRIA